MKLPHIHADGRHTRAMKIRLLARGLESTAWSQGIYQAGRPVVPGARPAQIKAAARKLYDVMRREARIMAAENAAQKAVQG